MELLQFYMLPKEFEGNNNMLPLVKDRIVFNLHLMLIGVERNTKVNFSFFMNSSKTPFYTFNQHVDIDDMLSDLKDKNSNPLTIDTTKLLAGEWVFFVSFDHDDFPEFGLMTVELVIDDKKKRTVKYLVGDGGQNG